MFKSKLILLEWTYYSGTCSSLVRLGSNTGNSWFWTSGFIIYLQAPITSFGNLTWPNYKCISKVKWPSFQEGPLLLWWADKLVQQASIVIMLFGWKLMPSTSLLSSRNVFFLTLPTVDHKKIGAQQLTPIFPKCVLPDFPKVDHKKTFQNLFFLILPTEDHKKLCPVPHSYFSKMCSYFSKMWVWEQWAINNWCSGWEYTILPER